MNTEMLSDKQTDIFIQLKYPSTSQEDRIELTRVGEITLRELELEYQSQLQNMATEIRSLKHKQT